MEVQEIGFDLNQFQKDGFIAVRNVFSEEECARFKSALLEEIEKGKKALEEEQKSGEPVALNRNKIADVPRAIHRGMLQDIAHRNPLFMDLAKDERVTHCITQILGPEVNMYRSLSVFKPKSNPKPVGWHQDMAYWKGENRKVSLWIALDDVDEATGALKFIPGTHEQLINETEVQDEVFSLVLPDKYIDESKAQVVEVKKGDMVFFDACVFHASGENKTGKDRYALVFTYQPFSDQSHHRAGLPVKIS